VNFLQIELIAQSMQGHVEMGGGHSGPDLVQLIEAKLHILNQLRDI